MKRGKVGLKIRNKSPPMREKRQSALWEKKERKKRMIKTRGAEREREEDIVARQGEEKDTVGGEKKGGKCER